SGTAAVGGMICAETVSTDPKKNAAASTGSLVQPKPVENSIVLPVSPVRAQDAEPSLRNCGDSSIREPTGCAKDARPRRASPRRHPAGLEARTRRAEHQPSVPNSGARWCPFQPTLVIFGR